MKEFKIYSYINVKWKYVFSENTMKLIVPFYNDYYVECDESEEYDFKVELVEENYPDLQKILLRGEEILIHNSEKPLFHDKGKKLDVGNVRYVFNYITKSVYEINYIYNEVYIYNTDVEMLARDGIRVSRDFVKFFVDKNGDFSMFHCSAVLNDEGECVVFIGEKNKGKTTISLDLIYKYGYSELSRDRVYIGTKNERLYIYGWPTYYNLTMKTLDFFEETKKLLPPKYNNMQAEVLSRIKSKMQLLPEDIGINRKVKEAFITHFVVLNREGEDCNLKRIIAKNSFSPYDTYTTEWNGMEIMCNKNKILSTAKNISEKLLNYDNLVVLNVDKDINETLRRLFEKIH